MTPSRHQKSAITRGVVAAKRKQRQLHPVKGEVCQRRRLVITWVFLGPSLVCFSFSYLMDLASELRAEKMVTFHKCWRLYIIPVIADVVFGKSLPLCSAT